MGLNELQKRERSEYLEKNLNITECSQDKSYVFISYSSNNWETVFKNAVVPLQRDYGLQVYADKAFDNENDKWIIPMLRNIRGAKAVMAFVSQSYIESYACFLELLTAVNNNVPVIFISLEDNLKLGKTTDQPSIERNAKTEIIRQGENLSTKTNNTSNDIMRAMKSSYTSLSTLLEQDVLSKYDISDAFINFFKDASINKKSINDITALRGTIQSVSRDVFCTVSERSATDKPVSIDAKPTEDQSAFSDAAAADEPVQTEPVQTEPVQTEPVQTEPVQTEPVQTELAQTEPVQTALLQSAKETTKPSGIITKRKKIIIITAALAVVIVTVIIFLINFSKTYSVDDLSYDLSIGNNAICNITYTGECKNGKPDGQGFCTFDSNDDNYVDFIGLWQNGELKNGKLTKLIKDNGSDSYTEVVYEGGFVNNKLSGQVEGVVYDDNGKATVIFKCEYEDGKRNGYGEQTDYDENDNVSSKYMGEYKNGERNGQGVFTKYGENENISFEYEGEFKDDIGNGEGKSTWYDENGKVSQTYEGEFKDGNYNGQGKYTWYNENEKITQTYEGGYMDNKRNGQGKETWYDENGNVTNTYDGTWKDGELVE